MMTYKEKYNNIHLPKMLALKPGETIEEGGTVSYTCWQDGETISISHYGYVNDEATEMSWHWVANIKKSNLKPIEDKGQKLLK